MTRPLSRRELLRLGVVAPSILSATAARGARSVDVDVHQRILDLAARQEMERRARFAAVKTKDELLELQALLKRRFLGLLDDLPIKKGVPPVQRTGIIEADDYLIEKLVFESFPGYFVSALLYKPKKIDTAIPGVLSPCGHSIVGKAESQYQILHINLARRGYIVLTYDPVGQGERSQFWDESKAGSRFNLDCGEHAVLGNPLYLLGTSLARYRIWDGIRGIDYLTSLPEIDPNRIGCVGNSGGGTLTAYIAALDSRVSVVAIGCYITTLPRRMGNRIQQDPSADPEQDIFGFVSEGIDHAGLLALLAPRPTLLCTARLDFFPIEGARESFAEAKRLYEITAGGDRIERVEADQRHGLTVPFRTAIYGWFERWLAGRADVGRTAEIPVTPRPARELQVCAEGQVNRSFRSRPLLPLALEEFDSRKPPKRGDLRELLRLDLDQARPLVTEIANGTNAVRTAVVCVNGNEARDWREEKDFVQTLSRLGYSVVVIDPRGVGQLRPKLGIRGFDYCDPLVGVEENIAYNAFLVGKSLLGMRVSDVLSTLRKLGLDQRTRRVVLCGRGDAALTACLAAAVEPAVNLVAAEDLPLSHRRLFQAEGRAINAASILPGLLRDFGDVREVLAQIAPRKVLIAAGIGERLHELTHVRSHPERFSRDPHIIVDWIGD